MSLRDGLTNDRPSDINYAATLPGFTFLRNNYTLIRACYCVIKFCQAL